MTDPISPFQQQVVIPPTLLVGNVKQLSDRVTMVNVFGDSPWPPGWYMLGSPAAKMGLPLAGPWADETTLMADWKSHYHMMSGMSNGFAGIGTKLFESQVQLGYLVIGRNSRIDSFVKLECGEGMWIGDFVHIASFCHIGIGGGTLIMEEGSSAGSGVKILTGSAKSGEGRSCSATFPGVINEKTTTVIRRNATLYAGAIILPGCEIGEGAVIGAGAVVQAGTKVPAGELWAGVPARRKFRKHERDAVFESKDPTCDFVYDDEVVVQEKTMLFRCNLPKGHKARHFQSGGTAYQQGEAQMVFKS